MNATWEVVNHSILGGEKGREEERRQLLEEELKNRAGMFHGPWHSDFFSDTSAVLESHLNYKSFRNMILMTGYPNAVRRKDKF